MNVTIIGSAFGLYGYLPALMKFSDINLILPKRYQEAILARQDISPFYQKIEWATDQTAILDICEGVVIATPPGPQYALVNECLNRKNITHLLLEKPLAVSPARGDELLNALELSNKKFRLGYNFRYTLWGKEILHQSAGVEKISWNFRAHHYLHNIQTWKRLHDEGGGALRFYGIHLIAFLAEMGYLNVISSKIIRNLHGEAENWEALLSGTNLPNCQLSVATNYSANLFQVHQNNKMYSMSHPFETHQKKVMAKLDQRVPFLTEGLFDLFKKPNLFYEWYKKANLLWSNIESAST